MMTSFGTLRLWGQAQRLQDPPPMMETADAE
jgi:hypothetical protein